MIPRINYLFNCAAATDWLYYINTIKIICLAEPLPLMDLCRRVIRQQVSKPRIEQGYLDKLNLPKPIKDYLQYKDRR